MLEVIFLTSQMVIIILIVVVAILGNRKLNEIRELNDQIRELNDERGELNERREPEEKRVTVSYEPTIHYQNKLFSNKVVAGYRAQIFYDELPIGEPTEK